MSLRFAHGELRLAVVAREKHVILRQVGYGGEVGIEHRLGLSALERAFTEVQVLSVTQVLSVS
jgi:hypothetical protein